MPKKLIANVCIGEHREKEALIIEINGGMAKAFILEHASAEMMKNYHNYLQELQDMGYMIEFSC